MRAVTDFRVIDESADWIVVDKPAPLAVHPSNGRSEADEPTLLGGLRALLACDLADGSGLSILTRLDRETSGLVLVAKSRKAARDFSGQLERREVEKAYLAVTHGWPVWDERRCDAPIRRAGEVGEVGESAIWLRQCADAGGKPCTTRFAVERRFERAEGRFALVRCLPESGRMHQIRVHLEHLGHPLAGDKIYGTDGSPYLERLAGGLTVESRGRLMIPRHALHAARLVVEWQGKRLAWESGLPPDLARFVAGAPIGWAHGETDGDP